MKIVAIIFLTFLNIKLQAQSTNGFSIQGRIKGLTKSIPIYLVYYPNDNVDTIAHINSENGFFRFNGIVSKEAQFYRILIDTLQSIPLFLDNSKISIDADLNIIWSDDSVFKVNISGSKSNSDFVRYQRETYFITKRKDSVQLLIKHTLDTSMRRSLYTVLRQLKKEYSEFRSNWIYKNLNSIYTPFLIMNSQFDTSLTTKRIIYEKLSAEVKNTFYGLKLKKSIEFETLQGTIKIGNFAPNFSSKTVDKRFLSLKEVVSKSKLTLIDFWASWCVPCREESPNLRKVYKDFHNKGFNILSIALDYNEMNWIDAIIKDSMIWYNVSQLHGRDEDASQLYGINGIPAAILLDSERRIIDIDASGSKIGESFGHDKGNLKGNELYNKVLGILGAPIANENK